MKAITLRNIPPQIVHLIQQKAKEKGTSTNKTVVSLLEECGGIGQKKKKKTSYHDLDTLAGSWTKEEAATFDKALAKQREIEPDLWK